MNIRIAIQVITVISSEALITYQQVKKERLTTSPQKQIK